MIIQYRAVLEDPGKPVPERMIQILTNSLHEVEEWAIEVLGGGTQLPGPAKIQVSDQARILVYATEEYLTTTFTVCLAKQMRQRKLHGLETKQ